MKQWQLRFIELLVYARNQWYLDRASKQRRVDIGSKNLLRKPEMEDSVVDKAVVERCPTNFHLIWSQNHGLYSQQLQ
jgi:hypothetical protein